MHLTSAQFAVHCEGIRNRLSAKPAANNVQYVNFLRKLMIGIHPVEKHLLQTEISKLPFPNNEKNELLTLVNCLKDGGSANFQDFTSMPNFLTNIIVTSMSEEASDHEKLTKLLKWAITLGLRTASAATLQALTAMWLMLTGKSTDSATEKKNMFDYVRHHWKMRVSIADSPTFIIGNLPSSPDSMARFAEADWWISNTGGSFEEATFVEIDQVEWQLLVRSIPIRSTRIEIREQFTRTMPGAPTPMPSAPTPQPVPGLADLLSVLQAVVAQPSSLRSQPALEPPSQQVLQLRAPPLLALPPPAPQTEEPEDDSTAQLGQAQTASEAMASGHISLLGSAQALIDHANGISDGTGAKVFFGGFALAQSGHVASPGYPWPSQSNQKNPWPPWVGCPCIPNT